MPGYFEHRSLLLLLHLDSRQCEQVTYRSPARFLLCVLFDDEGCLRWTHFPVLVKGSVDLQPISEMDSDARERLGEVRVSSSDLASLRDRRISTSAFARSVAISLNAISAASPTSSGESP